MNVNRIKDLVEKNKFEEAFRKLKECSKDRDYLNDVRLQFGIYNDYLKSSQNGFLNFEQEIISKAKIRNSLLQLIDELEKNDYYKGREWKKIIWLISLAIVFFLTIFILVIYKERFFIPQLLSESDKVNKPEVSNASENKKTDSLNDKILAIKKDKPVPILANKKDIINNKIQSDSFGPIIEGRVITNEGHGIENVEIEVNGFKIVKTNAKGRFKLFSQSPIINYGDLVEVYYFIDTFKNTQFVKIGDKYAELKFKQY